MVIAYLVIFIIACYFLARSGSALVKLLTALSQRLKITEYVFAFILMTFATTLPELLVGITSASRGASVIALGNSIGSSLVNISFILGLIAVLTKGMKVECKIAKRDAWIIFFIALIPLLLLFDGKISRAEGFLLLVVFGWYIYHLLREKEAMRQRIHHFKNEVKNFKFLKQLLYFLIAAAILVGSSWVVVDMAKLIARNLYLPLSLISIILVAIGTSLPELVFGVRAAIVKHEGLTLGNLVGSIVVNSTLILGIVAIINPIIVENVKIIYVGGAFMMVAIVLANIFLTTRNKVSWKEGLFLIIFYIAFLVAEFLIK